MEDMILKVPCPNDTEQCTVSGGEIMETVGDVMVKTISKLEKQD